MNHFVLFCKSYRNDIFRAKRLLESIVEFNEDHIPTFLSVPSEDIDLFENAINLDQLNAKQRGNFTLITDEEIVLSNPNGSLEDYSSMRGYLSQQVIKSEAWRYIGCDAYLCLDSDSFFIKPFYLKNFLADDNHPYSLVHKGNELLDEAIAKKKHKVIEFFDHENQLFKSEFQREGSNYDFGPAPLLWSKFVWESLDQKHLAPKGETIWDAIRRLPFEIRWYGEALLKFHAIPTHVINPLFKVYHYDWQEQIPLEELKVNYLGVVSQSNWDKKLDPPYARKSILSRTWKRIKKTLVNIFSVQA